MSDDGPTARAVGAPLRIVIAEDEAIIRLNLKETLEAVGHEVVGDVGNGEDAITAIRTLEPDLAILDINMPPGLSGLEVARTVHEELICAVLILTAFSKQDLVQRASDYGVMSYLVKPYEQASLAPAIELAYTRFGESKELTREVRDLREQLEVRKVVDRAKGVLMDAYAMKEADAFSFIQKSAMSHRIPMKDAAQQVIDKTLSPSGREDEQ